MPMPVPPNFPTPEQADAAGPCTAGGTHPSFNLSVLRTPGPGGPPPVTRGNLERAGELLGAAVLVAPVGCLPCQARHLDAIAEDPDTVGLLVEVADEMNETLGETLGLPRGLMIGIGAASLPDVLTDLWKIGRPGEYAAMYDQCAALAPAARREAASAALDLITGQIALSLPLHVEGDG